MTTTDTADDRTLVAAAQAGDRRSLDTLLRRHYDRVHAICRRIAGSSRDADDAAQEAMISIVRGLHRFDSRSAFTTWIYRIATNAALDELRKRNRRPLLPAPSDEDGYTVDVADPRSERIIEAVADRMALDQALAELPADFRTAVVLRDVGDLDYGEIAELLGAPVGTVKSRIARARARLVEQLGNREGAPERQNSDHDSGGNPPDRRPPP